MGVLRWLKRWVAKLPLAEVARLQERDELAELCNNIYHCEKQLQDAMAKAGCQATRPIYVGRPEAASPATGNGQRHLRELQTFLDQAIAVDRPATANQDAAE